MRIWIAGLAAALALLVLPAAASAATLTVGDKDDELTDDTSCTLREAVHTANGTTNIYEDECGNTATAPDPDTIQFEPGFPGVTLELDGNLDDMNLTGDLDSTDDLTIEADPSGPRVKIRGNPTGPDPDRVLHSQNADLTLDHVTIADGLEQNVTGGGGVRFTGGGDALVIDDALVAQNVNGVPGVGGAGGGVWAQTDGPVTITDSTISMNHAVGSDVSNAAQGGGIHMRGSEGNLQITGSTLQGNTAAAFGGAIFRAEPDGGTRPVDSILASTISGNSAGTVGGEGFGGGLLFITSGELDITRSTISGNFVDGAPGLGGGVLFTSALLSGHPTLGSGVSGRLSITNSTVVDNRAGPASAGGHGGGLMTFGFGSELPARGEIVHSTFSGNEAHPAGDGGAGGNIFLTGPVFSGLFEARASIVTGGLGDVENCEAPFGVINSTGGNVEGPGSMGGLPTNECNFDQAAGVDLHADPLLGPLASNGGPTLTRGLMAGSPAIDLVLTAGCPATDQRGAGFARPAGPMCDAGSFEGVLPGSPPGGSGSTTLVATSPPATTPEPPTAKKCKRGRKLRKGKCVKKRNKKK